MNLRQRWVDYDDRHTSNDQTELTAGLSHTFNPQWHGRIEGGATYVSPDYGPNASNDNELNPVVIAGLTYTPSPRTRITGDFIHRYKESDSESYGGQTSTEYRLGLFRDITAKLSARALASYTEKEYDGNDNEQGTGGKSEDDRLTLGLRFFYKLNRINTLELGYKHTEKNYKGSSTANDWDQNMVDVGWRVSL
jgi:hypothetical protein